MKIQSQFLKGILSLFVLLPLNVCGQVQSSMEIVDFAISECSSGNDEQYCMNFNRIVDSVYVNGVLEIELAVHENCGIGSLVDVTVAEDTLILLCGISPEVTDGGFCTCDYRLRYQISGISPKPYHIRFTPYEDHRGWKLEYYPNDFFTLYMPKGLSDEENQSILADNLSKEAQVGRMMIQISQEAIDLAKNDALTDEKLENLNGEFLTFRYLLQEILGKSDSWAESISMDSLLIEEQREIQDLKFDGMRAEWDVILKQFEALGIEWETN